MTSDECNDGWIHGSLKSGKQLPGKDGINGDGFWALGIDAQMHESLAFCSFWSSMTVPTLLLFSNYKGIWGKPQRVIRRYPGVL